MALRNKTNVYDSFIDGAKEGFQVAIGIVPYLVAILVAIAMFRTSGAMDYLLEGVKYAVALSGVNTDFVEALPTALMTPSPVSMHSNGAKPIASAIRCYSLLWRVTLD